MSRCGNPYVFETTRTSAVLCFRATQPEPNRRNLRHTERGPDACQIKPGIRRANGEDTIAGCLRQTSASLPATPYELGRDSKAGYSARERCSQLFCCFDEFVGDVAFLIGLSHTNFEPEVAAGLDRFADDLELRPLGKQLDDFGLQRS